MSAADIAVALGSRGRRPRTLVRRLHRMGHSTEMIQASASLVRELCFLDGKRLKYRSFFL